MSSSVVIPDELQRMLERYVGFCRNETLLVDGVDLQKIRITKSKGLLIVQLPHRDRARRFIQIEVSQVQDGWVFSDGGRIVRDCQGRACEQYLRRASRWYGLTVRDGALMLETPSAGFAGKFHRYVRALLTLDHLARAAQTEDVRTVVSGRAKSSGRKAVPIPGASGG